MAVAGDRSIPALTIHSHAPILHVKEDLYLERMRKAASICVLNSTITLTNIRLFFYETVPAGPVGLTGIEAAPYPATWALPLLLKFA